MSACLHRWKRIFGGVINMTNTIVGGGISIIACPYGIRYLGPLWFVIVEIAIGLLTLFTLSLMVDFATYTTNTHLNDLFKSSSKAKYINIWIDIIIIGNCGAVVIVFLDTMLNILTNIIDSTSIQFKIIIIIICILTYCLCLIPSTDDAVLASFTAMIFWIIFLIFMYYNVFAMESRPNQHKHESNIFKGITAINLTYTCQFNALSIYRDIIISNTNKDHGTRDTKIVFFIMFIVALSIYLSLGFASYYSFYAISDSLIDNLQNDPIALSHSASCIAQTCLGIAIFFSTPCFFIELRCHFFQLIKYKNINHDNNNNDNNAQQIDTIKGNINTQYNNNNNNDDEINESLRGVPISNASSSYIAINDSKYQNNSANELSKISEDIVHGVYDYNTSKAASNNVNHAHKIALQHRWFPTLIIVIICCIVVLLSSTYFKDDFNLVGILINWIGGIAANSIAWLIPTTIYIVNRNQYSTKAYSVLSIMFFTVFCFVFTSWILSF